MIVLAYRLPLNFFFLDAGCPLAGPLRLPAATSNLYISMHSRKRELGDSRSKQYVTDKR